MFILMCFFFASRIQHTSGALVTGVQTCALPIYRDPSGEKKVAKLKARTAADDSFKNVAEEWLDVRASGWTKKQLDKERARLKTHAYPWIGRLPIADIGVIEIRQTGRASCRDRVCKYVSI